MLLIVSILMIYQSTAQTTTKNKRMISDSKKAILAFNKTDPAMKKLFDNSFAYVVFPNVGKGGLGIGGAFGNGIVYKKSVVVGTAKLTLLSVGMQAGGQGYWEVIFFETKENFDEFKENNLRIKKVLF